MIDAPTLDPTAHAEIVAIRAADRDDAAGFDDRAFHDLFTQPRAGWPLPVAQLSTEDRNLPFSAWLARTDRVHY